MSTQVRITLVFSRCFPQNKPFLDINQFIESDNPGSTDSEVRKILTLHIPITEYDTLGSESDNDMASRSNQSNYRHHRGKSGKEGVLIVVYLFL